MAEQLYAKRFYLDEIIEAIWDDYPVIGADKRIPVFQKKYGPFKEEVEATSESERLSALREMEMKKSGINGLVEKLGIKFPTIISTSPVTQKESTDRANNFSFFYKIAPEFEKVAETN